MSKGTRWGTERAVMDVTRYLAGGEENLGICLSIEAEWLAGVVHKQQTLTTKDTKYHEGVRRGLFRGNSDWEPR